MENHNETSQQLQSPCPANDSPLEPSSSKDEAAATESPRPLAFTVDFGDGRRTVDTQRHRTLVEKLQKKHRRGQSLSKIEDPSPTPLTPAGTVAKKHPLTGNLPRKSSFQSEGYFSSDEKSERGLRAGASAKRQELSLPLRNVTSEKIMTQSFPNAAVLFNRTTPDIELKDISSPELDLISPFSPRDKVLNRELPPQAPSHHQQQPAVNPKLNKQNINILRQFSSPEESESKSSTSTSTSRNQPPPAKNHHQNSHPVDILADDQFVDGTEFDFDKKSDTVSDAGTYTLDADNYSEEQKARMSIDAEFKIEQISVLKKTEEYIKHLSSFKENDEEIALSTTAELDRTFVQQTQPEFMLNRKLCDEESMGSKPRSPKPTNRTKINNVTSSYMKTSNSKPLLSPILSPTQNLSIVQSPSNEELRSMDATATINDSKAEEEQHNLNNGSQLNEDSANKTFTRMMFPLDGTPGVGSSSSTPIKNSNRMNHDSNLLKGWVDKNPEKLLADSSVVDQGSVISVTSSGAFRTKHDNKTNLRKLSLTKSEIQVEAYVDNKVETPSVPSQRQIVTTSRCSLPPKLTANLVNVQNISVVHNNKSSNNINNNNTVNGKKDEALLGNNNGMPSPTLFAGKKISTNLPPQQSSGKMSPSKIPSPMHTMSRPRSRNSVAGSPLHSAAVNALMMTSDPCLSDDSSLETESYLRPTQNCINALQQRLSLDSSDHENDEEEESSDYDSKFSIQQRTPHQHHNVQQQIQLNNSTPHSLLKQRATHMRHNSLDDRSTKISNKLEHFQNKNFQDIDQTYVFNQYNQQQQQQLPNKTMVMMHKIQNSPNNSPIRRSSSFSTNKTLHSGIGGSGGIPLPTKNTNLSAALIAQKESNLRNSPSLTSRGNHGNSSSSNGNHNNAIQRSASTANIRPSYAQLRRSSVSSLVGESNGGNQGQQQQQQQQQHKKIDRAQFGDTESSSEDDFDKVQSKKKDLSNLTNTRYNRAFSLRRGRLDEPAPHHQAVVGHQPKCPNTPEMRRKFQPTDHHHHHPPRAISVDRKPPTTAMKTATTNDVQSRYLLNITKHKNSLSGSNLAALKAEFASSTPQHQQQINKLLVPKSGGSTTVARVTPTQQIRPQQQQVFSRTDSGRFSMRTGSSTTTSSLTPSSHKLPPSGGTAKNLSKKDGKKSSGRSNSSLSSREKEFQNWKRRKSYDPMKAAAEGKRKELMAKQRPSPGMTQSYHQESSSTLTATNQNQDCDSSPSHSSSVHRSQSFHGTAALEHLISSEDEEEDLTLSADEEGFSPPTPSPCELSPARASLRSAAWKDHIFH